MRKKLWLAGVAVMVLVPVLVFRLNRPAAVPAPTPGPSPESPLAHATPDKSMPWPAPKIHRLSVQSATSAPPVEVAAPMLPADMDLILGLADDTRYNSRLQAVHRLGRQLAPADVEKLCQFLETSHAAGTNESTPGIMEINAIKNDLLDALLRQETLPVGFGDRLVAMAANPEQDPVWRDYCVQHFAGYYQKRWPAPSAEGVVDAEREAFKDSCWAYTRPPAKSVAGSALLGLKRLAETHAEFSLDEIAAAAMRIAADPASDIVARIPAIQMAAQLGKADALPVARELARTPSVTTTLRLSSIAAIGLAGGADDLPFLKSLRAGTDKHLHKAASSAISAIEKRLAARGPASASQAVVNPPLS